MFSEREMDAGCWILDARYWMVAHRQGCLCHRHRVSSIIMLLLMFIIAYGAPASEVQYPPASQAGMPMPLQSQEVALTTVDGVKIRAFEITTGKDTMLIYCHRLLSSKESFDLSGFGSVFLREFDVLIFDFRGHKSSEWVSDCGGDEVLDLRAAIQYARRTGYQTIVLLGVGMGGVVAIREAALFGNADAIVAVSPCAQPEKLKPWWWNLVADISLTTDYGKVPIHILSNTRVIGRYWTGSPVYLVDRVSPTPLLLVHGQSDRYLNLEQVQRLYGDAKEPKKLLILPRSEHAEGLLDEPTAELIITWLKEVLSKQLFSTISEIPPSPFSKGGVNGLSSFPEERIPASYSTNSTSQSPIPIDNIDIHGDIVLPENMIKETIKGAADEASDFQGQLTRIRKEVEALHKARGYTLSHVSEIQLSPDGRLSLGIEVGQIDHLIIGGNHRVSSEQVEQVLRIAGGHYYNAWETETAVKRLNQFPVFANVESQLEQGADGNTVKILVKERRPWSFGVTSHFTDFDKFGGIQFSLNEFRSGAWRGFSEILLGLQHRSPLYRVSLGKGWFRQEALYVELGFERFIYSWDNLDHYFERQEARRQGGDVSVAYRITDNATIHLGLFRKRFAPIDWGEALPVDSGFINALTSRLENQGRFLRRGEFFFNWRSQTFVETATTRAYGDYGYTVFQFNFYPQLILSSTQALNLGLHWGYSGGDVPQQKLFSLGGDKTLPGYDDDTFVGEHVFLLRAKYDLKWGKWLGETSRLSPLGMSLLFDAGDTRMKSEPLKFDAPKLEVGVELNYASLIRFGLVKSLEAGSTSYFYFGWHPHLVRP